MPMCLRLVSAGTLWIPDTARHRSVMPSFRICKDIKGKIRPGHHLLSKFPNHSPDMLGGVPGALLHVAAHLAECGEQCLSPGVFVELFLGFMLGRGGVASIEQFGVGGFPGLAFGVLGSAGPEHW